MADYEYDDSTTIYGTRQPLEERWPPLGAASMEQESPFRNMENERSDKDRLLELEDEHEQLNTSLCALTTHFAQVQFRLKQIVAAPSESKEHLLMELEKFAFQGIPDVRGGEPVGSPRSEEPKSLKEYEQKISSQKQKQEKLIGQLKEQLEEMERCVVEGASDSLEDMSPEKLLEKQRIVIDQLSNNYGKKKLAVEFVTLGMKLAVRQLLWSRLGLNLDGINKMSDEDVRKNIDIAIGQLINPAKTKEQLVKQLTTQIMDLERFVQFLQGEVENVGEKTSRKSSNPRCLCPVHSHPKEKRSWRERSGKTKNTAATKQMNDERVNRQEVEYRLDYSLREDLSDDGHDDECGCIHVPPIPETPQQHRSKKIRDASVAVIRKALTILQIFAISQFGCTGQNIQDQILLKATTAAAPGYFELLARLKRAVYRVVSIKVNDPVESDIDTVPPTPVTPNSPELPALPDGSPSTPLSGHSRSLSVSSLDSVSSISSDRFYSQARNAELVNAVRKDLAMALKEVFQHGLVRSVDNRLISSKSLVACIVPTTRASLPKKMHVWELFNDYYMLKRGREYNAAPARKLSEAFGIELSGGSAITAKQTLLRALHRIKTTHEPCKRSMDSMFKSLVCMGVNQKRLVLWCRLISKTSSLIEDHYQSWGYVARTGMEEALNSMEELSEMNFHLPEDLAIRHLMKISDAFGET